MAIQMGYQIKAFLPLLLIAALGKEARAQRGVSPIYTTGNQQWQASDTTQYYLLLKNNKTCLKCYPQLYQYLQTHVGSNATIGVLSVIDSSVYARKRETKELNNLVPGLPLVLVDYSDAAAVNIQTPKKTSIFSKYKVDVTPALVIIKGKDVNYVPYATLYNQGHIVFPPSKL